LGGGVNGPGCERKDIHTVGALIALGVGRRRGEVCRVGEGERRIGQKGKGCLGFGIFDSWRIGDWRLGFRFVEINTKVGFVDDWGLGKGSEQ